MWWGLRDAVQLSEPYGDATSGIYPRPVDDWTEAPRGLVLATVDADRATADLAPIVGDGAWFPTGVDEVLGARCRRLVLGRSALILAEPATEGYVAACLARFGEGPIAVVLDGATQAGRTSLTNPVSGGPATYARIGPGSSTHPHLPEAHMTPEPMSLDEVERHRHAIESVRERRDASLRDPMGWLALVGLHWLRSGEQRFGADPGGEIVLRAAEGAVPLVAGTLELSDGEVRVHPQPDAALTIDGEPAADGLVLVDDGADEPTILELASLRMHLIRRGEDRLALRVKDVAAPSLRSFTGLEHFPIDLRWRVAARLLPAAPGSTIRVPDIVGDVLDEPTPGDVVFELGGRRHRLHALEAQPGHLWLIFGDATNGHDTYGGGRFLVSGPVQPDDSVEIDFNLAYNPPCVFSPFATCPLPPDGNRLADSIAAGERMWGAHE